MKISIFPQAKPHPKGKEEKVNEAFNFSFPHKPKIVEISNDEALVQFISTHAWSPFIFKEYRRENDFISTDFLVFDVDYGMTIEQCEAIVQKEKLCCLCLPSPSHTPEAHRFRIVLPLARTVTNLEAYRETWLKGAALFGVADEQCKDACRGYFGSTTDDGFWLEGSFFEPVLPVEKTKATPEYTGGTLISVTEDLSQLVEQIYGEKRNSIPEAVDFFIKNAHTGIEGGWTNAISAAAFSLTLSGVDEGIIFDVFEQLAPTGKLDSSDNYQIKRAIRDGKAAL